MNMYQKIVLIGNLGRDPEMRYISTGSAVTNFSMATTEKWTKDGQKNEKTTWWRVSVFGKAGEACNEYLKKGSKVYLEARVSADDKGNPRVWEDKEGNPRASFEVTASKVLFLSSRSADAENAGEAEAVAEVAETDEIAF